MTEPDPRELARILLPDGATPCSLEHALRERGASLGLAVLVAGATFDVPPDARLDRLATLLAERFDPLEITMSVNGGPSEVVGWALPEAMPESVEA